MKLKIIFIFFHTLLVLTSTGKVKEDSDYRNGEQSLRKQRSVRTDLPNGNSHFESKYLSKLQHTVFSSPEGSLGRISEQVTQNSNGYKESVEAYRGQQQLARGISSSTAGFHGEFFKFGRRLTQLENMRSNEIINKNECGGVIVGESGVISYKLEEPYLDNERCVWLVHSPNSTSITFHLRKAGFEKGHDYVSVTTIDPETGTFRKDTRLLMEYDDTVKIQESLAAIVFSSDNTVSGTGFFLTFSGTGVNTNHKYVYKLRHIAESNATIEYSASDRNDDEITRQQHIYVTATSAKGDKEWSQRFVSGIDLNKGIFLRANDSSCVYDSLTFYEPIAQYVTQTHDGIQSHYWQKKGQIPNENDTLLCPKNVSVPKQKVLLEFDVHSFLAIYKPISKDTFESNAAVSFDYYYRLHECAEIVQPLEGEFGIITYQEGNYKYVEDCRWIIEVTNATRIDFNLEQSGLHELYDVLAVTSLDMAGQVQGPTLKLRAGSPTASVTGSRAMVIFITDINDVESGFRLRYGSGISLEENVCGGVLNPMLDDFGVISYKANENYVNNENCQWTIEAPEWGRIGFNLEQNGFECCSDFLTICSVTPNGTEIGRPVYLDYNNRNASLAYPNALVRFTSDEYDPGTGFRLRYEKLPDYD